MEKLVHTGLLFDFYGGLLTEKQRRTMELYYEEDWSLAEIAEAEGVSRQAVHDLLHRTESIMEEFETKLGMVHNYLKQQNILSQVSAKLDILLDTVPTESQIHRELLFVKEQMEILRSSEIEEEEVHQ